MAFDILSAVLSSSAVPAVMGGVLKVLRSGLPKEAAARLPERAVAGEDLERAQAILAETAARVPPDQAHSLTLEALAAAHNDAQGVRTERMRQARLTFNAAITLAIIGVLIIFSGVGLLLLRDVVAAGSLTAGVGAVTEVVSAVLFRLNHEANKSLDQVGKDLSAIEAAQIAMTLIEKIKDPKTRDEAIREAAKDLRAHHH